MCQVSSEHYEPLVKASEGSSSSATLPYRALDANVTASRVRTYTAGFSYPVATPTRPAVAAPLPNLFHEMFFVPLDRSGRESNLERLLLAPSCAR